MSKIITSIEGQSITDIAIQEYGNRNAVGFIIENNPSLKNEYPDQLPADRKLFFDI